MCKHELTNAEINKYLKTAELLWGVKPDGTEEWVTLSEVWWRFRALRIQFRKWDREHKTDAPPV